MRKVQRLHSHPSLSSHPWRHGETFTYLFLICYYFVEIPTTIPPQTPSDVPKRPITANPGYCFQKYDSYNAVWGLTINGPRIDGRPDIFFFGSISNADDCEKFCLEEPGCVAYSLFSPTYDTLIIEDSYSGLCYGRGPQPSMLYYIPDGKIVSGFLKWNVDYCRESRRFTDVSGKFCKSHLQKEVARLYSAFVFKKSGE